MLSSWPLPSPRWVLIRLKTLAPILFRAQMANKRFIVVVEGDKPSPCRPFVLSPVSFHNLRVNRQTKGLRPRKKVGVVCSPMHHSKLTSALSSRTFWSMPRFFLLLFVVFSVCLSANAQNTPFKVSYSKESIQLVPGQT